MSEICPAPSHRSQVCLVVRPCTLPVAALLVLALGACAPEDKYSGTVHLNNDDDPAVDPDVLRCPSFDARYRARFKDCSVDADCEIVTFRSRCSALRAYAIASAERDAFYECAPTDADCDEPATGGRAEDGRSIGDLAELSDVAARCFEGTCEARVERRVCGSNDEVCGADELCMALQNNEGVREYHCLANPCVGQSLDCSCAQPVCEGRDDQRRVCAVEQIDESDVYCKTELR